MQYILHHGDNLEYLKLQPDNSFDSIVTDPPYGLRFMNKKWDYDVPKSDIWKECLRVLKPGGHLLAFFGTRTYHRGVVPIEDAGFEIRDCIQWIYGSGFPKSLNISKEFNKKDGVKFESFPADGVGFMNAEGNGGYNVTKNQLKQTGEDCKNAKKWKGWGTALKPACELIVMARKPIEGTVAENVLKYGTGGLNIDACRVELDGDYKSKPNGRPSQTGLPDNYNSKTANQPDTVGRWPANLIHDGSEEVLEYFPESKGQQGDLKNHNKDRQSPNGCFGKMSPALDHPARDDNGSAARFFYCAKTSKSDRNEGCDDIPETISGMSNGAQIHGEGYDKGQGIGLNRVTTKKNNHPTVKPTQLMRYLCKLVTPPGGKVLDPFMGSGSTGKAAILEGFSFVGCELEKEFIDIARARIEFVNKSYE